MRVFRSTARAQARAFVSAAKPSAPTFIDMVHSNNAARIRLWLAFKRLPPDTVFTKTVTYADLKTPEYAELNPLQKVPALTSPPLYESNVILGYLEDKFKGKGEVASFEPDTAEKRANMQLLIRRHDLYIASPNATQPGFAHTQGAMYLAPHETKHCAAERAMDRPTRAAKLKEMWQQLSWLEEWLGEHDARYLLSGGQMSLADFTWFPTCVFMDFMLPRVFNWPHSLFDPQAAGEPPPFPRLAAWYERVRRQHLEFDKVRSEIWDFWLLKEQEGQFESIIEETRDSSYKWRYP